MGNTNVNKNMLLNILRTVLSIIFPLITYPYATRILGTENFGKVSFSLSIISYIALIASLGISNYAIREGGFYRSNQSTIKSFSSELFTLNLITTFTAYVVLLFLLLCSKALHVYLGLLLIQGLSILFTTLGVDWLNIIFEDYLYITVRSIAIHILGIIMLFLFVHEPDDYYLYASITVINNGIVAIANFIHIRKKCSFVIKKPNVKNHIKPIMVLFSNNLAVSIYTNADITMIGIFLNDHFVGLYSIATKIYAIIKQVVAAAYTVTVTRLTEYYSQNRIDEYKCLLNSVINNLVFLSLPMGVGGVCTSNYIVRIIAGNDYSGASGALRILLCTVLFAVIGGALAYCINMPLKKEIVNLKCTAISAVENIVLNLFLIPKYGINGAAFSTLASEITVVLVLLYTLKDYRSLFDYKSIASNILKTAISSIPIIGYYYLFNSLVGNIVLRLILILLLSVISYVSINYLLKNDTMISFVKGLKE